MEDKNQAIRDLHEKINELARKQKGFQEEIQRLQNSVFELDLTDRTTTKTASQPAPSVVKEESRIQPVQKQEEIRPIPPVTPPQSQPVPPPVSPSGVKKQKAPWEEIIGTNLMNKVGIAILVIGIGFGVKYSIDHELLGPITRVILGYLSAVVLMVLAIRLKKKHKNFSAVLLSGGMAVLYFNTYAAYDSYGLIPQTMAFVLMVVFTAFTVFAAMQYDMEVIGLIGLVGAYAVPFLLSDGSGRVVILFSYVAVINTGILILAFKKYWKKLYYLAFSLTWIIYGAWHLDRYNENEHMALSLIFATLFFITFYITFLSYKLIRKEPLNKLDLFFMLFNSFVYYGFGYASINYTDGGDEFLGLFTLFTAVVHFIACVIIFKTQSQFRDIFYFVAGMVLVFLTLAVPVQLEGAWVTIVWAAEAALLFWIGRTKQFPVYERLAYPLILLAFAGLLYDWENYYPSDYLYTYTYTGFPLFLNIQFLTTMLVVGAMGFVMWLNQRTLFPEASGIPTGKNILTYGLSALVLFVLYVGIFKEVENFWNLKYAASSVTVKGEYDNYREWNQDLLQFKDLWLINYSAIFAVVLSLVQLRFVKKRELMIASLVANGIVVLIFCTLGLYALSELRSSYLSDANNLYYVRNSSYILIRYVSIAFVIPLLIINNSHMRDPFFTAPLRQTERILLHLSILVILSSELVHWLDMSRIENSFKLALSILWGAYALFLIVVGLMKDQKHLRISALVLFGVTLVKLFVYDMADMSTLSKTIVMIILGVLLLISSFLYNKFKSSSANEVS
jgi:uncharacterized membrane protein